MSVQSIQEWINEKARKKAIEESLIIQRMIPARVWSMRGSGLDTSGFSCTITGEMAVKTLVKMMEEDQYLIYKQIYTNQVIEAAAQMAVSPKRKAAIASHQNTCSEETNNCEQDEGA